MAGSLNRVQLIGNVGRDPEIRTVGSGRVANLTIATSERWKDKSSGEAKERTEWHKVTVWNDGLVGVVDRFVKKGSKLYVEGALQTRKYDKNGVDTYATEIVLQGFAGSIILLDGRDAGGGGDRGGGSSSDYATATGGGSRHTRPAETPASRYAAGPDDDEIPF